MWLLFVVSTVESYIAYSLNWNVYRFEICVSVLPLAMLKH